MPTQGNGVVVSTQAKADAEVSVSSFPIKLTLRIEKTKIKSSRRELLRYQIHLENIGKEKLRITDRGLEFTNIALYDQTKMRKFLYFELVGPDGKEIEARYPFSDQIVFMTPDEAKKTNELRAQGLSPLEAHMKVYPIEKEEEFHGYWLEPGDVLNSGTYIHQGDWRGRPGGFQDLFFYPLREPGKYKVRIVYDYSNMGEALRKIGIMIDLSSNPSHRKMKTPWIEFNVLPKAVK
ncbi:MAG: hypothetical protein WCU88_00865 [Elusimicrobiota bacterium]